MTVSAEPPPSHSWLEQLSDSRMLDRENRRNEPDFWAASSDQGMVASAHYKATEAGVEILSKGGNAFDAAVAVSLALGVAEPAGSGLGGMAMMLVYHAGSRRIFAIEGPCRAPVRATPEKVAQRPRKSGYSAVAVPSNPAVLDYVYNRYCSLPLQDICAPAIGFAREGVRITPFSCFHTREYLSSIKKGNAARFLLGPDGNPLPVGKTHRQPELAGTLSQLATAGFMDFYRGDIAREIVKDMQCHNGFICSGDLVNFPQIRDSRPVFGRFAGMDIASLAPPGDGTTLIQMLQVFDCLKLSAFDPDMPSAAELFARIIRQARKARRKYRFGSRDKAGTFVDRTSGAYAEKSAEKIKTVLESSGETTHFCIMDSFGNVVSATQSIERSFGAKVASEKLGFLYNGYMKGFKIQNKKHPHYLRPGAVARSNAAPTILLRSGVPAAAVGSTGSERMVSGIFETLVRLQYRTPFEAVSAPRLHCTPEGEVLIEADRFSPACLERLEQAGFVITRLDPWSFSAGGLQLVTHDGHIYTGVGEPRRDGAAAGPDGKSRV